MEYVVSGANGVGRVSAGSYLYDITEKPEVGFAFDALYFETPTNMNIKFLNNEQITLTKTEQKKCKEYCDAFYTSDDFNVLAVDSEFKIFKGFMKRKECKANEFEEVDPELMLSIPEWPLAKLVNNKGERVVACITEAGYLALLPDNDNLKFVLYFIEEEGAQQPKPELASDQFDFKEGIGKDARKLEDTRNRAERLVRDNTAQEYKDFNIVFNAVDPVLYIYQILEANNYTQNKDAATPFIDATIAATNTEITKDEFVARILSKYDPEYLTKLGAIHGKMIGLLDQLSQCETVAEIDAIMEPAFSNQKRFGSGKVPAVVDPFADIIP